ncbi:MAG: DUF3800 domain-containing protein [Gemmatimonadetes bacterium]|nr:DUF3800 domain-containing protein [Gemmatimonadota bacterium]
MQLPPNGLDVWYVDESTDRDIFAMTAVAVPFLRSVDGVWTLVWEEQLTRIREWRRELRRTHGIPASKELKASKLVGGRGRYLAGLHQLRPSDAVAAYRCALAGLGVLQQSSIISVAAQAATNMYGHSRLEAALIALLQRMRTAAARSHRAGMVFFDEGHGEYRTIYRKARVHLPTGSARGAWQGGMRTRSLPLDNFTKDANIKQSEHCFFTQVADLLSFAVLAKRRFELGVLSAGQQALGVHTLYDAVPAHVLNLQAAAMRDPVRGIVRI